MTESSGTIIFLGTAGARFMVSKQLTASGGMWLDADGTQILIDPGPGSIVQSTKRKLSAEKLSAIVLTHRHLDHSNDANIMVEAMTEGGFKQRGRFFCPADALGEEPVLFSYLRPSLEKIELLREGGAYAVGSVSFETPIRHDHTVETYGIVFRASGHVFSYISDTRYYDGLIEAYRSSELVILNVVLTEPRERVAHLSVIDAGRLIAGIRPKTAILTHYGMNVWRARPWELAEALSKETGVRVVAARDGMKFDLAELGSG